MAGSKYVRAFRKTFCSKNLNGNSHWDSKQLDATLILCSISVK